MWQCQCGKTNKRFDQNDEISRNLSVRGEEEDICRLEARNVESVIWLRCVRCRQVNLEKCLFSSNFIWWKISGEPEEWWRPTQWSACPVLLRCQPPPKHYTCDWPKPNMLTTITKIIQVTKVPDMIINHPHPIMMTYDQLCRSLSLSIFTSLLPLTNNQNNHHNDQDNRLYIINYNTWLTS